MRGRVVGILSVIAALASPGLSWAQVTRLSVGPGGVQANGDSFAWAVSANDRYVAYESIAANLVVGDTNAVSDVFVYDRQLGVTTRVSVKADGTQANNESHQPSISADGRYVAFASLASDLVSGDNNNAYDVFVKDTLTGAVTRVSLGAGGAEGNDQSIRPSISTDGRYVAFESKASTLVTPDANNVFDVFVKDTQSGAITRVSTRSDGSTPNSESRQPFISADGRYVAFTSLASDLVANDTNGAYDIFVYDRVGNATFRVSVAADGSQASSDSFLPSMSADGRYVAFDSIASNLVPGDINGNYDVFVRDRVASTTEWMSVSSTGAYGQGDSFVASISADGRYVAYHSEAANLVPGDTNGYFDIFVRDRGASTTTRISLGAGGQGNGDSLDASISPSGQLVAFDSLAPNLVPGDTNGKQDVFLWQRGGSVTRLRDFDGDSKTDVAVFRPSSNVWFVINSSTGAATGIPWGAAGDIPVPGDYDGDGKADRAVFRPSEGRWYVLLSSTGAGSAILWGGASDKPVPADYDGDGKTDVAVFRPSEGVWYIVRSSTGTAIGVSWGTGTDIPVPADYDGDGKADPTVFRPSAGTWFELRSTTGSGFGVSWGQNGDTPLAADFDGDGKADPTVFRDSVGTWFQLRSSTGAGFGVSWGAAGDQPMVGDYDGDGKADPTVFRPSASTWYQLRSSTGAGFGVVWGAAGDVPLSR